jgi:protein-S-isoprenylcysteine O-methyltransferase Ste14
MAPTLGTLAFGIGLLAKLANLAGVTASALGVADYYPFGERNWRYYTHWGLETVFNVSLLYVTVTGWNSLGLPLWVLVPAGTVFAVGFAGALLAGSDLGSDETAGLEGELRTDGWYRYSRNPQYVCYAVGMIGFAVLAATPPAIGLCLVALPLWFVLPFAEEPWLTEQYGEAYERYADRVPRFLGPASVRALVNTRTDDSKRVT